MEERGRRRLRAGERRGVRARGPPAGAGTPTFHRQDRFLPRYTASDAGELLRITERLEIEQDEVGRLVVFPPLEQVVRGDIGGISDRDEGRQPETASTRRGQQRNAERSALRGERQPSGGRFDGADGGVEARSGGCDTEDVRAEQATSVHAHESEKLILEVLPVDADLGEAGGDDGDGADPRAQRLV